MAGYCPGASDYEVSATDIIPLLVAYYVLTLLSAVFVELPLLRHHLLHLEELVLQASIFLGLLQALSGLVQPARTM